MSTPNLMDIGGAVRDWYRKAAERRELLALEDRALRDIGITRVDAVAAASRQLWRRRSVAPAPLLVDPDVICRHIERAHDLRAKAMADFARRTLRWLSGRTQPKARMRKLAPVAR